MAFGRVSPEEAQRLIELEGYTYVDVRSVPEFEAGHPTGAFNVPFAHLGPGGMTPNADFLATMEKSFPKDAKLVVGCKSGGRSFQAASLLQSAGYSNLVDQKAGFEGSVNPQGQRELGWRPKGLPTSADAPKDHSYEGLRTKPR